MRATSSILLVAAIASGASAWSPWGSQCHGALKPSAKPDAPHWMQTIKRQGSSPYNPNPKTYKVYRNVKDYGAKGGEWAETARPITTLTNSLAEQMESMTTLKRSTKPFPIRTAAVLVAPLAQGRQDSSFSRLANTASLRRCKSFLRLRHL